MEKTPKIKLIHDSTGEVVGVVAEDGYGRLRLIEDQGFLDYIRQKGIVNITPEDLSMFSVTGNPTYQSTMTEIPYFPEDVPWTSPDCRPVGESDKKPSENTVESNSVDHPKHYNSHPSGIECIEVARWYNFNIGNAIKYLWRHGLKTEEGKDCIDKSIEDLEKAKWYIDDEIQMLEKQKKDHQKSEKNIKTMGTD